MLRMLICLSGLEDVCINDLLLETMEETTNLIFGLIDCCGTTIRRLEVKVHETFLPVMAAIAMRKKVVSIGHFSPSFCLQLLQIFSFVRLNQEPLYVLIALKIKEK